MISLRKWIFGLLAACFAVGAQAATYTLSSVANYAEITDYTVCNTLPGVQCTNFPAQSNATGSFSVSVPFAPNYTGAFQTSSFSFTDGVNTYNSGDPNVRFAFGYVATDSSGAILQLQLAVEKWLSGSAPHAVGDRVSIVQFVGGYGGLTGAGSASILAPVSGLAGTVTGAAAPGSLQVLTLALHNGGCDNITPDPAYNSDPDTCFVIPGDSSSSSGYYGQAALSQSVTAAVPTLTNPLLIALVALMAGFAFMLRGRRQSGR